MIHLSKRTVKVPLERWNSELYHHFEYVIRMLHDFTFSILHWIVVSKPTGGRQNGLISYDRYELGLDAPCEIWKFRQDWFSRHVPVTYMCYTFMCIHTCKGKRNYSRHRSVCMHIHISYWLLIFLVFEEWIESQLHSWTLSKLSWLSHFVAKDWITWSEALGSGCGWNDTTNWLRIYS